MRLLSSVLAVGGVLVVSCAERPESGYTRIGPESLPSASYERVVSENSNLLMSHELPPL